MADDGAALAAALRRILDGWGPGAFGWAVEAIGPVGDLFPVEEAHVARAVPGRRAEFAAGRRAARSALAALGGPTPALPVGPLGRPIWPDDFTGSIAHDGRFAVAVAGAATGPWIAVDLVDRPAFDDFAEILSGIRHPADPPVADGRAAARLFAAKEAAIKILSPVRGDYVEFRDLRAVPIDGGFAIAAPFAAPEVEIRLAAPAGMVLALSRAPR